MQTSPATSLRLAVAAGLLVALTALAIPLGYAWANLRGKPSCPGLLLVPHT